MFYTVLKLKEFKDLLRTVLKRFASKLNEIVNRMSAFSLLVGKRRRKAVMLAVLVTIALTFLAFHSIFGQSTFTRTIGSRGAVKAVGDGIGIYWDSNCSSAVSSIDWGSVEPGLSRDVTVYVRNEGNDDVTLFLGTENWSSENASNYLTLIWDYAGETIGPDETVQVRLTLLVSSGVEEISSFSFDVIISVNA